MNNSELSIATPSTDAFTESQSYKYHPTWDNSHGESLSNPLSGGCHDDKAGLECLDSITAHGHLGLHAIRVQSRLEVKGLDLGLWLLCGSAIRQSQWENLQGNAQSAATVPCCDLNWLSDIKRGCDVVGSIVLLTVLSPLFILIATLIKLDSQGPVFFQHYRVGKDGKTFLLWKFRSMKMNVPKYAVSPQSTDDNRLTRIGRLIRRLSIDEIPQLINVLKGEMSLVGPRPEMPFIVESYRSMEHERLAVRPGITGLWQISPARAFPIHENLQYDFHYIHNQNLILDLAIILRTITAVIHGIGAV